MAFADVFLLLGLLYVAFAGLTVLMRRPATVRSRRRRTLSIGGPLLAQALFGISVVFGFVAWAIVAALYI